MRYSKTQKIATTGLLFALALVFSFVEAQLSAIMGLPPGVRIGLANVVVMYALFYSGKGTAALLVMLKALFSIITRGFMAGVLSLSGGALSLGVLLLLMLPKRHIGMLGLSVAGALAHNAGQMLVVRLWYGQKSLYYAPVLAVSGIVMGCVTAALLKALLPALQRTGPAGRPAHSPHSDAKPPQDETRES